MNQRTQQVIEELFELVTPGATKNALWQAYQELQQAEQQPVKTIESFLATLPPGIQEAARMMRSVEDGLLYPSQAIRYWYEVASLTDDGRPVSSSGSKWQVAAWVYGRGWIADALHKANGLHYEQWSLTGFQTEPGPYIIDYAPALSENLHGKQVRWQDVTEQDVRDFAVPYVIDYYRLHPSNHRFIEILSCGHLYDHHANWECRVKFSAAGDTVALWIIPATRGLEVFAHKYTD